MKVLFKIDDNYYWAPHPVFNKFSGDSQKVPVSFAYDWSEQCRPIREAVGDLDQIIL